MRLIDDRVCEKFAILIMCLLCQSLTYEVDEYNRIFGLIFLHETELALRFHGCSPAHYILPEIYVPSRQDFSSQNVCPRCHSQQSLT